MSEDGAQSQNSGGKSFSFGAWVTGLAFNRAGNLAFALGDGTLRLTHAEDAAPREIAAHKGAILCLAAHPQGGFLSGGDDGRLVHTRADFTQALIAEERGRWIEHVAASSTSGAIAWATGKTLAVLPKGNAEDARRFAHGSTINGIAFDPKGKRVATAHYGGISLWWTQSAEQKPVVMEWKGSHTAITWSPDGDYIVTAMQENTLHGFRLSDRANMRMAGYPSRIRSLSWTPKGKFLATAGAERAVMWPFDGKGPMGRNAVPSGPEGAIVTAIAAHPTREFLAAGYEDGMIFLMRMGDDNFTGTKPAGNAPVCALSWDAAGRFLAYGCEDGDAGLFDFGQPMVGEKSGGKRK
ncbi:MAG TPA: hypothetical protein PL096_12330 [Micropepsaceae bacterium]|nr:hypothetical protein [Micropepsaceae bacterium]